MAAVITTPEDVINVALKRFGYKLRVGSIYEGTPASVMALDVYSQTRDAVLREGNWDFSNRQAALALLKSAPATGYVPPTTWNPATHPQIPWLFEYTYPEDCLRLKSVRYQSFGVLNFDPQPNTYLIANDNSYSPARKVILCNVPDAIMSYVGQVTNPATWEPAFVEALASSLAERLAPGLANMEAEKVAMVDEQLSTKKAERVQG